MNKPETTANVKMHAYIIMLHLRSQGDLTCLNHTKTLK